MEFEKILIAIVQYGPHVIAIASAISAITPMPKNTNKVLSLLSTILSTLALNVGQAKRLDSESADQAQRQPNKMSP